MELGKLLFRAVRELLSRDNQVSRLQSDPVKRGNFASENLRRSDNFRILVPQLGEIFGNARGNRGRLGNRGEQADKEIPGAFGKAVEALSKFQDVVNILLTVIEQSAHIIGQNQ